MKHETFLDDCNINVTYRIFLVLTCMKQSKRTSTNFCSVGRVTGQCGSKVSNVFCLFSPRVKETSNFESFYLYRTQETRCARNQRSRTIVRFQEIICFDEIKNAKS